MFDQVEQECLGDTIEDFLKVDFQKYTRCLRLDNRSNDFGDGCKSFKDEMTFYEGTLRRTNQILHRLAESNRQYFGDKINNIMLQTNGSIIFHNMSL